MGSGFESRGAHHLEPAPGRHHASPTAVSFCPVQGKVSVEGREWRKTTGWRSIAPLAQLAEQLTLNQWVPGSSPGGCTSRKPPVQASRLDRRLSSCPGRFSCALSGLLTCARADNKVVTTA